MMFDLEKVRDGIHSDLHTWLEFNRSTAFESADHLALVAPFPPYDRMLITTGLSEPRDFASHGYDILKALSAASPQPLASFHDVLDFGVGAGRLARMFKGFRGRYTGIDVDGRNVAWVASALNYVKAIHTKPRKSLPFADGQFDLVISVSVFSHMSEKDHLFYLNEMARIAKPGAVIMLTTHGERALHRAQTEPAVFKMLQVSEGAVKKAHTELSQGGFRFIRQWRGHLNSLFYAYGITFISSAYIHRVWAKFFDVLDICSGAIHDFQDVVVLRKRA
ncbi:MAG: class I SAM-dependent methyltransferase [Rhodospirillaceae bacterium]|nr:class I SAM-dependent methyltransferase [Rhodospirillaceae bacterium]